MTPLTRFITRVYALLLRLYPRGFRDEFSDEMQATFAEAATEATHRSFIAVTQFCLRELWELPVNLTLEHWTRLWKGSITMTTTSEFDDRPLSWLETGIGLLPFLLFGPMMTWLAYPYPYATESFPSWFFRNRAVFFAAGFLLGLIIGWRSHWQRWTFSYLGLGVMIIIGEKFQVGMLWIATLAAITLIVTFLLTRGRRSLQSLFSRTRYDWTPLSFGLLIVATIAFCGIDHEEDPNLTLLVILPGVTIVLSALLYLRSRNKRARIWSLVLGIMLLIIVSMVRYWFYILYGIIAVVIVFLPALLEFLPRQDKAMLAE